jgi:sialic acid synthase SpsE
MSVTLVAEVGCNHMGRLDLAKEAIKVAAVFCKADVVKFQKRNPRECLTPAQYNGPHPNPAQAFGETYGAHREFLEFSIDQHRALKACCEAYGVEYATSVWDLTSAREAVGLAPGFIKIPSACNTRAGLLGWLCGHYGGALHVSLGMTTRAEEEALVALFERQGRGKDLVLYSCTAGYPVAPEEVCLLEITRLLACYGGIVKAIGFSGHHKGIALDMGAAALGAAYLERHFTLDRTWKGTDQAASLEPDGLRKLQRDLQALTKALTYKQEEILEVEKEQRRKLKEP